MFSLIITSVIILIVVSFALMWYGHVSVMVEESEQNFKVLNDLFYTLNQVTFKDTLKEAIILPDASSVLHFQSKLSTINPELSKQLLSLPDGYLSTSYSLRVEVNNHKVSDAFFYYVETQSIFKPSVRLDIDNKKRASLYSITDYRANYNELTKEISYLDCLHLSTDCVQVVRYQPITN